VPIFWQEAHMSLRSSHLKWKPLLVCPHAAMSYQTQAAMRALGGEPAFQMADYPEPGTIAGLVAQQQLNLCFLDVSTNPDRALPLIAEISTFMPVVAMQPVNDADMILRCLRRGAREFLSDFTSLTLREVMDQLGQSAAPLPGGAPAKIYCVIPGKPGCGATTLAVHLALELRRCGVSRLLLVDADSLSAGVAFLLKLKSDFHLGDAVRTCFQLDQEMWSRLVTPCRDIDVLAAPEDPSLRVVVNREAAAELTSFWRERYEVVVIDTDEAYGSGRELALRSDYVLLVTTNEMASLYVTQRSIESLERCGMQHDQIRVLVNRYTPAKGLKPEDVAKALKISPYALLRNDYESVQRALLDGRLVASDSQFGRSIHQLAERLVGKEAGPRKRRGLFALLHAGDVIKTKKP
jgi:pilus assembly protein CpaE